MARKVIVQPGQCIEDIALQEYGSINAVRWVLEDNLVAFPNGYSTDLASGTELVLRDESFDAPVHAAVRRAGIVPATNAEDDGPTLGLGGDFNGDFNDDFDNET